MKYPTTGKERLAYVDAIIASINANFLLPGIAPQTSEQLRNQADRRRDIAVGIRINGGEVNDAYRD